MIMVRNLTKLLCLILLINCSVLTAQISITAEDLPTLETNVLLATVKDTPLDLGTMSEGASWDLSGLDKSDITNVFFGEVADSEDPESFPDADFSRVGGLSSLIGIDIDDLIPLEIPPGTAFYKVDDEGDIGVQGISIYLNVTGIGDLGQGRLFADPDYQFWHTGEYGDNFTNTSEMTLEQVLDDIEALPLPDGSILQLTVDISTDVNIDGYGTMTTPDFEEEVLRYTEVTDLSVYANILSFGVPLFPEPLVDTMINTTTLRFYAKDIGYPIASINYLDDPAIPNSIEFLALPDVPEVAFSTSSTPSGCLTVQFNNDTDGFAAGWNWEFGDGQTSTEEEPQITFDADGEYEVTLTGVTFDGQEISNTQTITIVCEEAVSDFIASYSEENCLEVTFFNNSEGDVASAMWDFGDGNTSEEDTPTYTYAEEGIYDVSLTVTGIGGDSNTSSAQAIVSCTALSAAFEADTKDCPLVAFTNSTEGLATSYQWDFGDGSTSADENPMHTFDQDGAYIVTLTAFSGDQETNAIQNTININCFSGVEELLDASQFTLSPNPASDVIQLELNNSLEEDAIAEIIDISGRTLSAHRLPAGSINLRLQTSDLSNGIYLIKLQGSGHSVYLLNRFVVNH